MLIDKFRAKASKSAMAQSLIKKLDRMDRVEVDDMDTASVRFRFPPPAHSGKIVITAEHAGKNYGDKHIFGGANFIITKGEKIGLVGRNGEGKSTMMKMIANKIKFDGNIQLGHNILMGYFEQDQEEKVDLNKTVFETIDEAAVGEIRKNVRGLLGSFLFSGDTIEKKVKVLSGGEKSRLAMCKLLLHPYNLLVLDEPTNHLDMRSKDVLKNALMGYDGTLIIVSHDRDFLQGLTNKVFEFKNKSIKQHIGDVYAFLASKKMGSLGELEVKASAAKEVPEEKKSEAKEAKNVDAPRPKVVVLEAGVVGSLDYKIITAERADDLFEWLKDNKYQYNGDEATLNHYVQKKWIFTVMKIDTMQMKRNKDGTFAGEVTPTRFQFSSDKLVYPLKITQISVKDKTEALFYVQAPTKVDLEGDFSYQYQWAPMLDAAAGCTPGGLPGRAATWLKAVKPGMPALLKRAKELDFAFIAGQRPQPNRQGRIPTTMEWARKLTTDDIAILTGKAPYGETVPNVDEGFNLADIRDAKKQAAIVKIIQARLDKSRMARPNGYLVRHAPADDLRQLQQLTGHLREGMTITKFRKIFTRGEMNDDLVLVPARYNDADDDSEYEEIFPVSPP